MKQEKPDVKLLIGFRDLVAERLSYWLAYQKSKNVAFHKAVKLFDNICIPDALSQLGVTITPAEDLSVWVKKALNNL